MFEHRLRLVSRYSGEPVEKFFQSCAGLKVLEECPDGHARAAEYPVTAQPIRRAFDCGALRPVQHGDNLSSSTTRASSATCAPLRRPDEKPSPWEWDGRALEVPATARRLAILRRCRRKYSPEYLAWEESHEPIRHDPRGPAERFGSPFSRRSLRPLRAEPARRTISAARTSSAPSSSAVARTAESARPSLRTAPSVASSSSSRSAAATARATTTSAWRRSRESTSSRKGSALRKISSAPSLSREDRGS